MRKLLHLILLFIFSSLIVNTPTDFVYANQTVYEDIDIHVTLNKDGSANFVERWYGHFYEGTEHYVEKGNLAGSTIRNFTVTEDGETYTFIDDWQIDASQKDKTNKNGIIETGDGVELIWGIGKYGTHEYIIEYTVDDFIIQLDDAQVIHWYFMNSGVNIPRTNVRVEIESFDEMTSEKERIWAFGYDGSVNFSQGNVIAQSSSALSTNDYVILLIKFSDGTFTTDKSRQQRFEQVKEEAMKGSDYDSGEQKGFFGTIFSNLFDFIFKLLIFGIIIIALVSKVRKHARKDNFTVQSPAQFKRQYLEEYYREYPYEGNYLHAYFIVYRMGAGNFNTLLTSLLLKWLYEDKIYMSEITTKYRKKIRQVIHFNDNHHATETLEGQLYQMMKTNANEEGIITDREVAHWAKKEAANLQRWEQKVLKESAKVLEQKQCTQKIEQKIFFAKRVYYELTEQGNEAKANVHRFINYLHDYSLLSEHEAINVKLWDEMMIWAAYLNLTTVVKEQFEQMYPNYAVESKYQEQSLYRSTAIANTASQSRNRELKRQQRARSSGSGGSASSGGGGGASGGGGGGVR